MFSLCLLFCKHCRGPWVGSWAWLTRLPSSLCPDDSNWCVKTTYLYVRRWRSRFHLSVAHLYPETAWYLGRRDHFMCAKLHSGAQGHLDFQSPTVKWRHLCARPFYIGYFCCDKILEEQNLRTEELVLVRGLRSSIVGRSWWQTCQADCHSCLCLRKQKDARFLQDFLPV